jgi:ribonuclease BN (tRNA processing enzyme)
VGPAWAVLVGGVFGDPLLHVRIRNLKQSFLFDLGDPARLHAKVAHQVRTVFLSHAHVDHIGGFLWFLRSRIGHSVPCGIFGPADTISRIENFVDAVTWDRIGDDGPVFEVCEIGERALRRARLQPGKKRIDLPEQTVRDGTILSSENFHVKAAVCDHGIPSVAYALVFYDQAGVKKDELEATGLPPGPWLGRLKEAVVSDNTETEIQLPDGTKKTAKKLVKRLIEVHPGKKLVYAADMADTAENREKLTALARSAHTLFCETAFSSADKAKADATQHLTAGAAVEIARAALVERLVPFHFSKRYENEPWTIYEEIRKAAGPVEIVGELFREEV